MKKGGGAGVLCLAVAVAAVVLLGELGAIEAVTCSPVQLSPCLGAITSGGQPSPACCQKLQEQKPCLCGYLKDPNLKQYVNSPNARKVASSCGVRLPSC